MPNARNPCGCGQIVFCPLRNRICSQPNARNPCGRNRLFSGRCQAQSAHGRMGFARWRAVFLLKNSRAPPILRLGLPRWIDAPPACASVPLEGLCWPWTSPDDRGVGWVERGSVWARNPMPNARNPCGRNRLFSGRCQAQSAHGRMGFARWRAVFLLKNSRAPPILRLGLPRWIDAPPACAGVPLEGLCWPWTSPDDRGVGWVERGSPWARNPMPNARNPCCRNRLFSGRCQAQSAHSRMGFARWRVVFLLKNSRAPPILRLGLPRWIDAPPACAGVPLEGLCWPG